MVADGCRSSVEMCWQLKPQVLGSSPSVTTFLSKEPFAVSKLHGQ